ncbi:MAG TPA: type II toxin-antitoxin system HicA family toxin [Nitrososphaerales archaeon]
MSSRRLPSVSWREVLKALSKKGFKVIHQKGSHIVLVNLDGKRRTVVPRYKEIKPGTLLSILDQAGLTKEDFINILK